MRSIALAAIAAFAVFSSDMARADPPPVRPPSGSQNGQPAVPSHVPGTEDDPLGGGRAGSANAALTHPNEAPADGINRVVVHFIRLRSDEGRVRCALFDSADGFPSHVNRAVATTRSEVHDRRATCTFTGIHPGVYAVIAYHDENGNSKFDRNWIGMPTEGHATSNDVKTLVTVPKFKDASFYFPGGDFEFPARMMY